jgi:iron complex transport system ATP-binding protein
MPESHSSHDHDTVDAVVATDLVLGHGSHVAVQASSFTIPMGQVTTVIGPNGSGKSTLLHAIAGLITPLAGSLRVLDAHPHDMREHLSYVLQYTTVPVGTPITVAETVMMGRYPSMGLFRRPTAEDRARVREAMDRLRITDLAARHLSELSGGQRQRVYVAQGIAQEHDVLLLDEPLTGLDIASAQTIDEIIHQEPTGGCTVIQTTHDLDEARAADHVVLLAGRVIAAGPPEEVLTAEHLMTAYGLGGLHAGSEPKVDSDHHHHHEHDHHQGHAHDHGHDHPEGRR